LSLRINIRHSFPYTWFWYKDETPDIIQGEILHIFMTFLILSIAGSFFYLYFISNSNICHPLDVYLLTIGILLIVVTIYHIFAYIKVKMIFHPYVYYKRIVEMVFISFLTHTGTGIVSIVLGFITLGNINTLICSKAVVIYFLVMCLIFGIGYVIVPICIIIVELHFQTKMRVALNHS